MASKASNTPKKGAAPAAAVATAQKTPRSLGICSRPVDLLLVVWYAIFCFSVMFTDLHNFIASLLGVTVKELRPILAEKHAAGTTVWPPQILTFLYYRWSETIDPLLYENPIWWQCIEWVNLCCLMPFSIYAFFGFFFGWRRLTVPAIVVSSFTFYSLIMCIGSTLFGPQQSDDPWMFVAIYIPYLIMPALIVLRVAGPGVDIRNPFAAPIPPVLSTFLFIGITATLAVFFSYVAKWFVLCEPGLLGPLLPFLQRTAELPGGAKCPVVA